MLRVYDPAPDGPFDEARHQAIIEALRAHFAGPSNRGLRVWNLRRVACRLGWCQLCHQPLVAGWAYRQLDSGVSVHQACAGRLVG